MKLFSCRSGGGWFLGLDTVTCIHWTKEQQYWFSDSIISRYQVTSVTLNVTIWPSTGCELQVKWCTVMMLSLPGSGRWLWAGPGGHQSAEAPLSPPGQRSSVLGPGGATTTNKNSRLKYQWVYFVFCKAFLLRCSCLYSRQFFSK